jgi:hypothetical protein
VDRAGAIALGHKHQNGVGANVEGGELHEFTW